MDEVVVEDVEDAPAVVAAEQPEQPEVVADEPAAAEAEPDVVAKEAPAAEEPAAEEAPVDEVADFSVVPDEEVSFFFFSGSVNPGWPLTMEGVASAGLLRML